MRTAELGLVIPDKTSVHTFERLNELNVSIAFKTLLTRLKECPEKKRISNESHQHHTFLIVLYTVTGKSLVTNFQIAVTFYSDDAQN